MSQPADQLEYYQFVTRSREHIMNYPYEYRWEITRRHPYYLGLWQVAQKFYVNSPFTESADSAQELAAMMALGAIGVTGKPIPPSSTMIEIGSEDPIFLCGSVQPMTIRNIMIQFLSNLGSDNQEYLAKLLAIDAVNMKDPMLSVGERQARRNLLLSEITKRQSQELDSVFVMPMFYFHLNASQETIKEDANRQAKIWKERRGMGSPKIHTSKLSSYLEVWDAVEGWTGEGYDITREQIYNEVASSTKKTISTIHDHHNAAFHAIIGVKFSPAAWWNTMGRYKLASFSNEEQNSHLWLARHRFGRTDTVTKASNSQPTQARRSSSSGKMGSPISKVESLAVDEPEKVLLEQIMELIHAGKSVDHIRDALNLVDPWSEKLILYIQKAANSMESAFK